jgi:hypothetical protein
MLITLYEDTNPVSFNQDFAENIILPRNAELKLLSAFCNRLPLVEISAVDDLITLTANDKLWSGTQVAVPTGSYSPVGLMDTIAGLFQTINVDEKLQLFVKLTNLPSKNFNAGALIFELNALSLYYDEPNIAIFNNVPTGYVAWEPTTTLVQSPVVSIVVEKRNNAVSPLTTNYLGISDITDSVPSTINDIRNCINFDKEEIVRTWYSENGSNDDPARPRLAEPYGMVNFTIQKLYSNNLNWWVGLTNSTPDLSDMTFANADGLNELKGVNYVIYYEGVGGTFFNPLGMTLQQGDFLIGEHFGSGSWTWTAYEGVDELDEWALCLPQEGDNKKLQVAFKPSGGSIWNTLDTTQLGYLENNTPYNFCFGAEQPSGTSTNGEQQIKNLFMTSKQSYTHLSDMGQYIEVVFSQSLADKLGFSETSYKEDKTGTTDKAVLKFSNDKDATTKTNGTEPPFVCLNLNNLPVKSYTQRDTRSGAGYNGVSSSRTIANLSRFDYDGGYNGHLTDEGNNQPLIKLKNAEEITLSQLRVRLTNVDGTIPQDLSPPFCANIEITEGK